jgi:plasmid stability protein
MADMLIRDVPDDVVAALDARASRMGLSRSEYVRRLLARGTGVASPTATTEDLARFADVFADLDDPDVTSRAWR